MSLCALIYSKIRRITSVGIIVIVGNQIYSSLNTVKGILAKCMVMPELRGFTTVYATGSAFETPLTVNYHSFIHFNGGNYLCCYLQR